MRHLGLALITMFLAMPARPLQAAVVVCGQDHTGTYFSIPATINAVTTEGRDVSVQGEIRLKDQSKLISTFFGQVSGGLPACAVGLQFDPWIVAPAAAMLGGRLVLLLHRFFNTDLMFYSNGEYSAKVVPPSAMISDARRLQLLTRGYLKNPRTGKFIALEDVESITIDADQTTRTQYFAAELTINLTDGTQIPLATTKMGFCGSVSVLSGY